MTVIAWDGKILAADKRVLAGVTVNKGVKIRRFDTRINKGVILVGYSGPMSLAEEFFAWAKAGFKTGKCPSKHFDKETGGTAMVIRDDKSIWVYDHSAIGYQVDNKKHAIGAGHDAAMACMHLHHTAYEAVVAASTVNCLCGDGVDTLTLEPERKAS